MNNIINWEKRVLFIASGNIGKINEFTGISSPYEEPEKPELRIDTGTCALDSCVQTVLEKLTKLNIIP